MNDHAPATFPQQPVILKLPSEITFWNAAQVSRTLTAAISGSDGGVIVDLTGTEFCGFSGISLLRAARRLAGSPPPRLQAIVPPGPLARLFAAYGVDRIWVIHPSRTSARPGLPAAEKAPAGSATAGMRRPGTGPPGTPTPTGRPPSAPDGGRPCD